MYAPVARRSAPRRSGMSSYDAFAAPGLGFPFLALLPSAYKAVKTVIGAVKGVKSTSAAITTTDAQIDQAYSTAVYGNDPAAFSLIQSAANAGSAKAAAAVNDLRMRGWYGGQRSAAYASDNSSATVNHGQDIGGGGGAFMSALTSSGSGIMGLSPMTLAGIGILGMLLLKRGRRGRRR